MINVEAHHADYPSSYIPYTVYLNVNSAFVRGSDG